MITIRVCGGGGGRRLIFIGGDYEWTGVAASAAKRMNELRPSFRRVFGSAPRVSHTRHPLLSHDRSSLMRTDHT